ncbi:Allantoicase [Malassezia caprae]|uniref:Allantoicase n=1 Tax=Malassezia caprae TaxID=1381934 RepID=A0AAF0E604_9BASI|nr:Allantoicase [Malassezia caprae]
MTFEAIQAEQAAALQARSVELSCASLGGSVRSFSDEWFADAVNLIKPGPAVSLKGQFGPKGALYDGWETRRHNPDYDWVILRLAPAGGGRISGFDVDTTTFNGNEVPAFKIYGLWSEQPDVEENSDQLVDGGLTETSFTHVKLHMIPDGGISRFRVYGQVDLPPVGTGLSEIVVPKHPELNSLDLAHMLNGARHFGVGSNLLLPGRGKDMGDGWETKRSRTPGHRDWVVVQLAEPGVLSSVDIDTLHFLGNFPESCEIHGCLYEGSELIPPSHDDLHAETWFPLVSRTKLGPGRIHNVDVIPTGQQRVTSHVRLTMHPDGGIKRLRVYGRRAKELFKAGIDLSSPAVLASLPPVPRANAEQEVPQVTHATSLTPHNFAPYGEVVMVPPADHPAPGGLKRVNQDTASKHCELAHVVHAYPEHERVQTNVHVYTASPT